MNIGGHNSQLSAWFDNELTAAERAIVDRRLEESAEDRDELADFRQISNWLSELPPETLPVDFAREFQAFARESVAPAETDDRPRLRSDSGNAVRPVRWTQGLGILLTTAAMLFVAFALSDSRDAGESLERGVAVTNDMTSEESAFLAQADDNGHAPLRGPADTDHPFALSELNKNLDRIPQAHAMPGNINDDAPADTADARDLLAGKLRFRGNLKDAKIGEIIEAIETTEDQVSVVRLTVVDRQEGLRQLQVLLSRNDIPRTPAAKAMRQSKIREDADNAEEKGEKQNEQLVAVYVEATGDQLASVIDQIRSEKQFQTAAVDRPINIAELAQALPSPSVGSARPSIDLPSFSASAVRAVKSRNAPVAQSSPAKEGNSNADKKDASKTKPNNGRGRKRQSELERISLQLHLKLKPEMFTETPAARRPLAASRGSATPAETQVARRRKDNAGNVAKSSPTPDTKRPQTTPVTRQVLFVLDVVPAPADSKSKQDDGSA